jgi:hypothetical protein
LQNELAVSSAVSDRLTALTARGTNTTGALLVNLVTAQLARVTQHEHAAARAGPVILFWLKLLCASSEWYKRDTVHVLVDQLVKAAVTCQALESVLHLVAQLNITHKYVHLTLTSH